MSKNIAGGRMIDLTTVEQQQQQQQPQRTGCQWLHRLINRRLYKLCVLVIVCILNVIDLVVDWYFFVSKATIENGLVFGPPPRNVLLAIFIFCIVATLTSLLEIVQILRDTYQNRPTSLLGQLTNLLTLWFEDVPLLTLNLLVVICRDGEVTYVSLTKAIVGIVAALIRFLFILLNKWLIRHDYQRKDRLSQFFNTISTVGVIVVFILSISINIIASLPIDNFGNIRFQPPAEFQRLKFAHQKYFDHVGIFLQSPTDTNKYIYMTHLTRVIEKGPITFEYSSEENGNIFCFKQQQQNGTCFFQNANESSIHIEKNPLSSFKLTKYAITFRFKKPDFYYLLGDIRYNLIQCGGSNKNVYVHDNKIFLRYFRLKKNLDQLNSTTSMLVYNENNGTYRFYQSMNDFEPVEHLWKTGLSRCTSTSSHSPHRSQDVQMLECL